MSGFRIISRTLLPPTGSNHMTFLAGTTDEAIAVSAPMDQVRPVAANDNIADRDSATVEVSDE